MRISVIGTGYLGATHAACLAELGFEVLGVDSDVAKVTMLAQGELPFSEPGLPELLRRHVASGRLRFGNSLAEAAAWADLHFVCVGTPQSAHGPQADLGAVLGVTRELSAHLTRDALVVGKSTVPVGTSARLGRVAQDAATPGVRVRVAWNPEFLREGHAVADTLRPDRLVFGVEDEVAEQILRRVYAGPIGDGVPVHVTDPATAELAKAAANSFLAMKISFVNAMAELSEQAGADVVALAEVLGDDARIGRRFLDAGVGFGGGCLPKDIRALGARAAELGVDDVTTLLDQVDRVNLRARHRVTERAVAMSGGSVRGRRVTVLGSAFKPMSDDVRDSPALAVAADLHRRGALVRVHDPEATANATLACPELQHVGSVGEALTDSELVLHLPEWPQFREIDPLRARALVRVPRLLDARNKLDRERWQAAGWTVTGVGRGRPRETHLAAPQPAATVFALPTPRPRRTLRTLLTRA